MWDYPHLVRPPCPQCQASRTIQTCKDSLAFKERLYCPECRSSWDHDLPQHRAPHLKEQSGVRSAWGATTSAQTPGSGASNVVRGERANTMESGKVAAKVAVGRTSGDD